MAADITASVITDAKALSGPQRVAILVMYLEPDVARLLLQQLSTEDIREIGFAMASVDHVEPQVIEEVVAAFIRDLYEASMVPRSGQDFALQMLPDLIDEGRRAGVAGSLRRELSTSFQTFIAARSAQAVASILQDEHPQVQSVALLLMGPENAANVLAEMDEHERLDLASRISRIEQVPGEFADQVEASIRAALEDRNNDRWAVKGLDNAARALARLSAEQQAETLERIAQDDSDLADQLKRRMVVFEDVANLDDRSMQTLLKNCERNVLALALRGAEQKVLDVFFRNMSSRAAEDLRDDIELLGPTARSRIEESRDEIVQVAVRLRDEGVLQFGGSTEDMV